MLRELDDIGRKTAVGAIRALEVELFGNHAWSEASIRQELDAPARVYVFDVTRRMDATRTVNPPSADSPATGTTARTPRS